MKTLYKLIEQGKYHKAVAYLKKEKHIFDEAWLKAYYMAECYKLMRKYDKAVAYFHAALSKRFDSDRVHYGLATTLEKSMRYHEAIERFKTVIAVNPSLIAAYGKIGLLYAKNTEFEEAIAWFRMGISRLETSQQSECTFEKTMPPMVAPKILGYDTIADATQPRLLYPYFANYIGVCYFEMHRYTEAKQWFTEALHTMPFGEEGNIASHYMSLLSEEAR